MLGLRSPPISVQLFENAPMAELRFEILESDWLSQTQELALGALLSQSPPRWYIRVELVVFGITLFASAREFIHHVWPW